MEFFIVCTIISAIAVCFFIGKIVGKEDMEDISILNYKIENLIKVLEARRDVFEKTKQFDSKLSINCDVYCEVISDLKELLK